ncbi:MAG TPA: PilZ domain-containing protein [Luteibacter sp.]|jgi:hypothetical protein|nr:PilZ domain-containing protein [Luteibacter sp.]
MSEVEHRRAPRKRASSPMPVMDVMSEQVIGQLGNLSTSGLMLIGLRAPATDAVYQVSLALPDAYGHRRPIQLGIQEQWHEPAAAPGQYWSGYRIVAVSDEDTRMMENWLGPELTG